MGMGCLGCSNPMACTAVAGLAGFHCWDFMPLVLTPFPLPGLPCPALPHPSPSLLQVGEAEKELGGAAATNPFAQLVDEAEGLDKIEDLQVGGWRGGWVGAVFGNACAFDGWL